MIRRMVSRTYHGLKKVRRHIKKLRSIQKHYLFNIDTPKSLHQPSRQIIVEGWIIPKNNKPIEIRIRNNSKIYDVDKGVERFDVGKTHGTQYGEAALYSGFRSEFEFEDGRIIVEVNSGRGFKKLDEKQVKYGLDKVPSYYHNHNIAWRLAEHQNLIENRKGYFYEEESAGTFKLGAKDPRLVAIYLPQFHPIPENDHAWGKGFTEWTNVSSGQPRFIGHQQPILPSNLGFYDLRYEEKMLEQIELAKKYGIYGFQFYYYWFSGKKVMDGPLNYFLSHKEWDFNFSICWANENWTKRWDGRDDDIIVAQEYREEDPLEFIKDISGILNDERYISYRGKPILTVYRTSHLKDPKRYAMIWREYFKKHFDKELYLVSCMSFDDKDPTEFGFDAAMDFAPLSAFFKSKYFPEKQYPYITIEEKLLDVNFDGVVADYRTIATTPALINRYDFKTFGCVAPSWDNDARKNGKGFVFQNSSPDLYAAWLDNTLKEYTKNEKQPIVFLNAWNEWAEGAVLEPTRHLGYAVLNRTAEVLARYSSNAQNLKMFSPYGLPANNERKKIVVIIHLFHSEMWPIICERLKMIKEPYDIFMSVREQDKNKKFTAPIESVSVNIVLLPNRGRDVLPFLFMLRRVRALGYTYILKLHTKKSSWRDDGAVWFDELLQGLLPSSEAVQNICQALSDQAASLIGPSEHIVSLKRHMGSNRPILENLLRRTYGEEVANNILAHPEAYPFVGGTMFWARCDALDPLLGLQLLPDDFQSEHGQIDGTIAHAIERYTGIIAQLDGRHLGSLSPDGTVEVLSGKEFTDKYKHAP